MKVYYHKDFLKKIKKLQLGERKKLKEKLKTFLKNEFNSTLNNHPLRGKYKGYRSINITGDLRAVYKKKGSQKIIFVVLGTHSNLYN